jgi:hypothetical protein
MLTTTALVLLTATASLTVTPTLTPEVTPTPVVTMTDGEAKLFAELVKCGVESDKAVSEAYDNGWKDGVHEQWCFVQCKFLENDKERIAHWKKLVSENTGDNFYTYRLTEAEQELKDDKRRMKKEKCDCVQLLRKNQ